MPWKNFCLTRFMVWLSGKLYSDVDGMSIWCHDTMFFPVCLDPDWRLDRADKLSACRCRQNRWHGETSRIRKDHQCSTGLSIDGIRPTSQQVNNIATCMMRTVDFSPINRLMFYFCLHAGRERCCRQNPIDMQRKWTIRFQGFGEIDVEASIGISLFFDIHRAVWSCTFCDNNKDCKPAAACFEHNALVRLKFEFGLRSNEWSAAPLCNCQ